ncbi:unnamed protein product [Bursaphelenchus xylophilus]|uniref:(pine wood nematode) hypothetical protein n=1 Tax=Bursaphelenchus xylophilus TaxID=6326 RepID=A0A1I7S5G3_BURXY|nr:unnamed protein product [Bursaphelenchus xylophilus]CAG9118055.1 unnamed protein product [Bursaphelenchus xylophilus]
MSSLRLPVFVTFVLLCKIYWADAASSSSTAASTASGAAAASGATSGGSCADVALNCPMLSKLCNNPTYVVILTEQCPKTCGICTSCKDSRESCGTWKNNGFCESAYYTQEQKRQFCANSCDLCGAAATPAAG